MTPVGTSQLMAVSDHDAMALVLMRATPLRPYENSTFPGVAPNPEPPMVT
jgi:hypothetical protein